MSGWSLSGVGVRGAAVLAGAVLLVAGCSGDGDGGGEDDGIAGAESGRPTEEPESGTEPEDQSEPDGDTVERPNIEVGPDLEMVFEDRETGDPVKDAVLLDNEWQIKAVFEVLTTHDRENSSVGFYTTGEALINDMDALERIVDRGVTSGGVMRFFKREVTRLEEGSATVSYCRDFSEVYDMDFETRDVTSEADPTAQPTYYEVRLELNDAGVWQTTSSTSERQSAQCR